MFHFEGFEDGGAVVGDEDVADVVDEHFVEADGAEGGFDDVGYGEGGGDVADADVLAGFSLAVDELACYLEG